MGITALAVTTAAGDDRTTADALLKDVEASGAKESAGEFVARARSAQSRSAQLRASGDEAHARLADSVARTWAEAARDVSRSALVEQSASVARRHATDAGVVAERERALLEEAIAQSGRLRAQLDSIQREGKEQPTRTSASANTDAGTRATVKAAPSATDAGGSRAPSPKTNLDGGPR